MRSSAGTRGSAIALSMLVAACGGGSGARDPATARAAPQASSGEETTRAKSAASAPGPVSPPAARCDDGTCFPCGAGSCPIGFYCDEDTKGGAACAWLPACTKATCDCITHALRGCKCSADSGGPTVRCD